MQEGIANPARTDVTSDRFRAAVMGSGISNLLSCQYTANNGFSAATIGAPLQDEGARRLYFERLPLLYVSSKAPPMLIMHGAKDHCTLLGQAEEFHRALLDHGVPVELVIYSREGHSFKGRAHHFDAWRRKIAWFDPYLQDQA